MICHTLLSLRENFNQLHFLSDDCQKGGHVLDLILNEADISMDETPMLHIEFAPYPTKPLEKPDSYKS